MTLFVGVEGGATRASAVVMGEDAQVRGRADGPAIGVTSAGHEAVAARIVTLVATALGDAGAEPPAAALCCGLTGAGREPERAAIEALVVTQNIAHRVQVTTDLAVAFFDAFQDAAGILLIAGTGSAALGRVHDGRTARAGGWGAVVGDEGSAYAIGLAALRAVLIAHDGRGPATGLSDHVLQATGVVGPAALVSWADAAGKREIAALAPGTLALVPTDSVAAAIAGQAAADLASHVHAIAHRLAPWSDGPDVALTGGLISPGRPLRPLLEDAILAELPFARVGARAIDGARGAAMLAMRG